MSRNILGRVCIACTIIVVASNKALDLEKIKLDRIGGMQSTGNNDLIKAFMRGSGHGGYYFLVEKVII